MKVQNYLIPQDAEASALDTVLQDLFTSYNVAFASAATIAVQPDFSTKLLVTLPEDQAVAASHATTFIKGWGFGVANTFLSSLNTISTLVVNLLQSGVTPTATILDQAAPGSIEFNAALANFQSYLTVIKDSCCDLNPDSYSLLLHMQAIQGRLTELSGFIQDDSTKLDTAIQEVQDQDVIQPLLSQQKDLQQQFADGNAKIAEGAVSTIPSDISFGFSFASKFISGITPGAVAGAAVAVAGEAKAIIDFNKQTQALQDQQSKIGSQIVALMETIAQDQQEKTELTLVAAQVDILNKQIQDLLDDTGSVISQLSDWAVQIGVLASQITLPSAGYFTAQVTAGQQFWVGMSQTINRYLGILALNTRQQPV